MSVFSKKKVNKINRSSDSSIKGRHVYKEPPSAKNKRLYSDKVTLDLSKESNCFNDVDNDKCESSIDATIDNIKKQNINYTPDTTVLGFEMLENDDSLENVNFDDSYDNIGDDYKKEELDNKEETNKTNTDINKVIINSDKKIVTDKKEDNISNIEKETFVLLRKSNNEIINVTKSNFIIGKSKFSDYQVVGNNTVSRSHAIIIINPDGTLSIKDNKSKNGTSVDGIYIDNFDKKLLSEGQIIRLSDEEFEVLKR